MKYSFVVRYGIQRLCNIMISAGNAAPYHITQPSTDNDLQIVSPTATMATLTCSLNITIPFDMLVFWDHNGNIVTTASNKNAIQTSHSTTLIIRNLQSSDGGLYRCTFNIFFNNRWVLRRHIRLLITSIFLLLCTCLWCSYRQVGVKWTKIGPKLLTNQ